MREKENTIYCNIWEVKWRQVEKVYHNARRKQLSHKLEHGQMGTRVDCWIGTKGTVCDLDKGGSGRVATTDAYGVGRERREGCSRMLCGMVGRFIILIAAKSHSTYMCQKWSDCILSTSELLMCQWYLGKAEKRKEWKERSGKTVQGDFLQKKLINEMITYRKTYHKNKLLFLARRHNHMLVCC